jgi:hypothetical protein
MNASTGRGTSSSDGPAISASTSFSLLGVSLENGIATVDLSSELDFKGQAEFVGLPGLFRLTQLVYTVTQFPEVEGVRFELEGRPLPVPSGRAILGEGGPRTGRPPNGEEGELLDRPVTREDYDGALPAITFEAPRIGAEVASPVRMAGTANVPDGTVRAVVLDGAGTILAKRVATVTCGADCRGDYELEVPFAVSRPQSGVIELRVPGDSSFLQRIPVALVP